MQSFNRERRQGAPVPAREPGVPGVEPAAGVADAACTSRSSTFSSVAIAIRPRVRRLPLLPRRDPDRDAVAFMLCLSNLDQLYSSPSCTTRSAVAALTRSWTRRGARGAGPRCSNCRASRDTSASRTSGSATATAGPEVLHGIDLDVPSVGDDRRARSRGQHGRRQVHDREAPRPRPPRRCHHDPVDRDGPAAWGRRSGRGASRSSTCPRPCGRRARRCPGVNVQVDPVQHLGPSSRSRTGRPRSGTWPSIRGELRERPRGPAPRAPRPSRP